jgi:hypothetical protein
LFFFEKKEAMNVWQTLSQKDGQEKETVTPNASWSSLDSLDHTLDTVEKTDTYKIPISTSCLTDYEPTCKKPATLLVRAVSFPTTKREFAWIELYL